MAQQKPFNRMTELDQRQLPAHEPVLTPEESRQGVISGRVIMILIMSLVLALIAFVIVYSAEII